MTPFQEKLAAKLYVFIEGVADHKMDAYNIEKAAKEIVLDIVELVAQVRES